MYFVKACKKPEYSAAYADLFRNGIRQPGNHLRRFLPGKTTTPISRTLKRLRVHGLLKRAGSTYKYCLTKLGRLVLWLGSNSRSSSSALNVGISKRASQSAHLALAVAAEA
jgi:hypothetical protein